MRATLRSLIVFAWLSTLAWAAPEASAESGKDIFLSKKCNLCHSIKTEGIFNSKQKKKGEADDAKPAYAGFDDDFGDKKKGAPDLSAVGKGHDPEWMTKFLKKKIRTDEGKKHKMRFKGKDEELQILVEYLASLKTEVPEGASQ